MIRAAPRSASRTENKVEGLGNRRTCNPWNMAKKHTAIPIRIRNQRKVFFCLDMSKPYHLELYAMLVMEMTKQRVARISYPMFSLLLFYAKYSEIAMYPSIAPAAVR